MILVDSNVIIYYFNGIQKAETFLTDNIGNMAISTLTISEVLSKPNSSEKEIDNINLFLKNNFQWIDVSREIIYKSAEIRRHKKIKTPDAIIGATALLHHLTLATRNVGDFEHLPMTVINPID
ncbi:PIN domain [Moraxella lacunata]|uniref:PIN domain n=1 Tax=Moraxella lacunata TaxID=477 RepID=A0A378TR71_MORLA|nr:type II toxin-antitoxin system VapC family toxin [Moraxella lacunata]STZ63141.1 PIN domain [Moraxella lacunata]